ncbi:hypothetical protein LCGC14_1105980 [marine sediment metagenome]|uniref:Uncharacterized protein n=1 Tax=marine sediment metagenome TaxID=412755 RepID=A0A0F9M836_9ZZZZ
MTTKRTGLWASKDRYTEWERRYSRTHPDGTIEIVTVESTHLAHPRKQQVMMTEYGARVIDRDRRLVNRKTGRPIRPRTRYYTLSQSFRGGPSANGDALGGFNTGGMTELISKARFDKAIKSLATDGFTLD